MRTHQTAHVKLIVYAGAELLTGDDIAAGVLRYCEALAGSVVAEVIEIPVREADGSLSRATLLVGPTSQMVVREVQSEFEEVIDLEVMRRLGERTRAQRQVAGIQTSAANQARKSETTDEWQSDY